MIIVLMNNNMIDITADRVMHQVAIRTWMSRNSSSREAVQHKNEEKKERREKKNQRGKKIKKIKTENKKQNKNKKKRAYYHAKYCADNEVGDRIWQHSRPLLLHTCIIMTRHIIMT